MNSFILHYISHLRQPRIVFYGLTLLVCLCTETIMAEALLTSENTHFDTESVKDFGEHSSDKSSSSGTKYYLDSDSANDTNLGISASNPWQNLDKMNDMTYSAGSVIHLKYEGRMLRYIKASG